MHVQYVRWREPGRSREDNIQDVVLAICTYVNEDTLTISSVRVIT